MLSNSLVAFGVLLLFATAMGFLGDWLRLPRVTSYLLAGVVVGPSLLSLIGRDSLHELEPVADLAMALVLFNLGSHFSFATMAKIRSQLLPVSFGELTMTLTCVAGGLWLIGVDVGPALMLGCLAMATAPATTVIVLKELHSEGPVTESAQALVAINNLSTIVVFELLILILAFCGGDTSHGGIIRQVESFGITLLGSVLLGAMLGLALSFSAGFLSTMHWIPLLMASSMLGLGICEISTLSYMLTFLVMGFAFANTAQENDQDLAESSKLASLLCVAFFVIHGAELRLDQFWQLGAVGTAYIVLRILGKYFGIRIAARWTGKSKPVRHWLGATMLSQAGAAIALAAHAVARDRVTFEPVQTVILGSVIVFEIMGPLMIRLAVIRSGEVPIAYVARHSTMSFADGWRAMWWKLRTSLGADPQPAVEAQEMTIASLMRSRVLGIKQDARFDEIISHIEHSHDNTFPVINATNQLVGIIRYPTLSESLFDPSVSNLVRAEDLATSVARFVYPDQPVSAAFDFFMSSRDDCIPVVSREEANQLVGIVRRADVRTLLIRKRRKGSGH